jgi:hypothetical protein
LTSRVVLLICRNINCKHLNTSSKDNPQAEWTNGAANEMKLKGVVRNTVILTVLFTVRHWNAIQYHNTLLSYRNSKKSLNSAHFWC